MHSLKVYTPRPYAVFGIADTPDGHDIADEMMCWLFQEYEVHAVIHDGKLFEQPALRYAQRLSLLTDQPVLYIHTKGAYNKPIRSQRIRDLWRLEFGHNKDFYFKRAKEPGARVICPFTGPDRMTRYNGFVANADAWGVIPEIRPNADRMVFEKLWKNAPSVEIVGTIYNDIDTNNLGKVHEYLRNKFA